jgi:glycosyltransferase involved in cell wall biosynthesis
VFYIERRQIELKVLFNLPSIPQYSAIFQTLKHLADKLELLTVVTNEVDPTCMNDIPNNLQLLVLPRSKPQFLRGLLFQTGYARYDIIHDTFGYFLPLGVLSKFSKSKYITSGWGCSASWYFKAREIGFGDQNELNLHRQLMFREHVNSMLCDAILVNSPSFSKDYVNYYRIPESKIYEVPEPVTLTQEIQFSLKMDEPFNILYVGQISQMKGIHVLLEAFRKVNEEGHDARLTAIGKFIPHDREIIESQSWINVEFIEPLSHKDLTPYFQRANLYVHPSYQEGMPRVVMEALSYGVPVVASDLPGIKRLDDTGHLIRFMENFDVDDLKKILSSEILHPRKNQNFFRDARSRMGEFSPEIIANNIFKIYENL